MLDLYKYTDKEKDELINSIVILVDTREKTSHILDFFDKKGITWKKKKLDYGDYSFMLPANDKLNIPRDIYFDKKITIEKKSNLTEVSGNLTTSRDRLEKELALAPKNKVILIENADYSDIIEGNYGTKYNKKSFLGTLHSFWHKYSCPIFFIPNNKYTGVFIMYYFKYYLHNYLR